MPRQKCTEVKRFSKTGGMEAAGAVRRAVRSARNPNLSAAQRGASRRVRAGGRAADRSARGAAQLARAIVADGERKVAEDGARGRHQRRV